MRKSKLRFQFPFGNWSVSDIFDDGEFWRASEWMFQFPFGNWSVSDLQLDRKGFEKLVLSEGFNSLSGIGVFLTYVNYDYDEDAKGWVSIPFRELECF